MPSDLQLAGRVPRNSIQLLNINTTKFKWSASQCNMVLTELLNDGNFGFPLQYDLLKDNYLIKMYYSFNGIVLCKCGIHLLCSNKNARPVLCCADSFKISTFCGHNSKCDCKMLKFEVLIRNVTAKC